jgi:hypothetical protein
MPNIGKALPTFADTWGLFQELFANPANRAPLLGSAARRVLVGYLEETANSVRDIALFLLSLEEIPVNLVMALNSRGFLMKFWTIGLQAGDPYIVRLALKSMTRISKVGWLPVLNQMIEKAGELASRRDAFEGVALKLLAVLGMYPECHGAVARLRIPARG